MSITKVLLELGSFTYELSMAVLYYADKVVVTKTIRLPRPKIFTMWPFKQKTLLTPVVNKQLRERNFNMLLDWIGIRLQAEEDMWKMSRYNGLLATEKDDLPSVEELSPK